MSAFLSAFGKKSDVRANLVGVVTDLLDIIDANSTLHLYTPSEDPSTVRLYRQTVLQLADCCKEGWRLNLMGGRFTSPAEPRYSPIEG